MHRTFFLFLFLSIRWLFYGADLEWVENPVSNLMSNPANWNPAQTPQPLDNLIFTKRSQVMNVTNDLGTFQLGNLAILDNYTIDGNAFELLAPPQPSALTYGQTVTAAQINVSAVNIDGATVWPIIAPPGPGATISSPITGVSGGLNLLQGELTLSGGNTYGGSMTLSAGTTLISGSSSSLSNQSSIVLHDNATLDLNDNSSTVRALSGNPTSAINLGSKISTTFTLTAGSLSPMYGTLSGSGEVILNGGQLTLLGTANHTGATILQNGANLLVSNLSSVLPNTPALTFQSGGGYIEFGENSTASLPITANGPVFIGTNTYDVNMTGPISGSGQPFTKIGSGTLTMTGANNNTNGPIQILGGVLNLNTTSLGSAGTIQFNEFSGTLQAGSDLTISNNIILTVPGTIDTNGHTMTISGAMIDAGSLTKAGLGTLYLTSFGNTYAGQTIIKGGILNVPSASYNVPASTTPDICAVSQLVFQNDGGTFQAGSDYTPFASAIVLMGDGTMDTNSHAMTAAGVIAGPLTSTFTKAGIGTFTLKGANLYTGPTQVLGGTLQAGIATSAGPPASSPGAFGILSDVTVGSAAVLDLNGYSNTVGSLAGSGAVTLGAGTLTIGDANGQIFSGNLSPGPSGGSGGLILLAGTKTGLQIFSGTNTYTGPTLLSGGTFQAGSAGATSASSNVTVASGAILDFQSFSNSIHSLSNSGFVKSGANIASAGAFTQFSNGVITLDFPKSTLAEGGGKITANGVSLNGTLNLTTTGGASAPSPGQNIVLFNTIAGSIAGDFSTKTFPPSWAGISVETLISPSNPSQYILRLIGGACTGTWQQPGPGNWGVQSYWSGTCIPGIHGSPSSDTATFQGLSPSSIIVTLADDAGNPLSVVLQAINFTNASTSYTIAPSGLSAISLNAASTPQISVTAGNHTISAPIAMDVSSMMTVTSGSLTLSGAVSSSDSTISLTKQGAGTLILGGANPNTYTGPTMITEGVVQAGKPTALGSSSAVTVSSLATLDLNGFAVGAGSLSGAGNIQLGAGTLTIGNGNGQNFSGPISGSAGGGESDPFRWHIDLKRDQYLFGSDDSQRRCSACRVIELLS